jgi:hypothetical protein
MTPLKPSSIPRALPYDMPIGAGIHDEGMDGFLPKGKVHDLVNYRALIAANERIQPCKQYTDPPMAGAPEDPAQPGYITGEIQPILGYIPFEDAAGNGHVFVASARRIYELAMPGRTLPAPYAATDYTSIYATGLITSPGGATATITGGDGNGTAGTNLWPLKAGDIIRYLGVSYTIVTVTGSSPCVLTFPGGTLFPITALGQPYECRRLFTGANNDTFTFCPFYQGVNSGLPGMGNPGYRIIITNGGGNGAISDGAMTFDPILYWEPTLASFQPLPGTNNLRAPAVAGVINAMTAHIVVAYKDMVLAMNCRERSVVLGAWSAWVNATNRVRNTGIGSSEEWNLVGGVGYSAWYDFADTAGGIEASCNWKDLVVIAKRDEVNILAYTGGTNPVFQVQKVLHNEGTQYRHGLCALREDVVMIGNRDFYRIVEGLPSPFGSEVSKKFFEEIDENNARQVFVIRWKQKNEMWFFCRTKGYGLAYAGCDVAYIWNYEHASWSRVELALNVGTKRGITCAAVMPYLRCGVPWSSLDNITWAELTTAGTTWAQLDQAATMETPLLGSATGDILTWEGGDDLMPSGHAIAAQNERDGLLITGLLDLGQPDFYKRVVGLKVEFEGKATPYQSRMLYSAEKCSIDGMPNDTGWQNEGYNYDVTAKYFVVQIRQAAVDASSVSEMAQLRLRYYLRGQR